jgi:hypothetical protein
MARFWVLMTLAATLFLTGLASMTEDPDSGVRAVALPATNAAAPVAPVIENRNPRKSYERRNQRGQSADNSHLQTGSVLLTRLAVTPTQDTGPSTLEPIVPRPIALTPDEYRPAVPLVEPGLHARKPVPKRGKGQSHAPAHGAGDSPGEFVPLFQSNGFEATSRGAPPDAKLSEPRPPRASSSHSNARRKSGSQRHRDPHAGPRRPLQRQYARVDSLWPRAQRDGS